MDSKCFRPGGIELTESGARLANIEAGNRVLDVGCGTGVTLGYLGEQLDCQAYGVDISTAAVGKARLQAPRAQVLEADAAALPFEDAFFDAILMECSLSLFDEPGKALAEAARVLRQDGSLLISTLSRKNDAHETSAQEDKDALVIEGAVQIRVLDKVLRCCGFEPSSCTDHSDCLVQMLADILFQYGSMDSYLQAAETGIDGSVFSCNTNFRETGYTQVLARRSHFSSKVISS